MTALGLLLKWAGRCLQGTIRKMIKLSQLLVLGVVWLAGATVAVCWGQEHPTLDTEAQNTEDQEPPILEWQVKGARAVLRDEDPRVLAAAIQSKTFVRILATHQEIGVVAIPSLIELVKDTDRDVSSVAAVALGRIGPEAVSPLIELLNDSDKYVRSATANALGRIGPKAQSVVPSLIELLNDSEWIIRMTAAEALGRIGPEAQSVVPTLIELLNDSTRNVRISAVQALGEIGPGAQSAVPFLNELLKDSDYFVRSEVTRARGRILEKAKPAILPLIGFLQDTDNDVRTAAAEAIGRIGPEAQSAVPSLIELLKDSDKYVRSAAAKAIGRIGPGAQSAVPSLIELLKDSDKYVRSAVVNALGHTGSEAVPSLIKLLQDSDSDIRSAAAEALCQIGPEAESAIPSLIGLLNDSDSDVRSAAAEAIGCIGPESESAIPSLIELLKDSDKYVRSAAAAALGRIGPEAQSAVPSLIKLVKDSDTNVRLAAAEALCQIGTEAKTAVPSIIGVQKYLNRWNRSGRFHGLIQLGPIDYTTIPLILNYIDADTANAGQYRFWAHFMAGGDSDAETLIAWLGRPRRYPEKTHSNAVRLLEVFNKTWDAIQDNPADIEPNPRPKRLAIQQEFAQRVAVVVKAVRWRQEDIPLLEHVAKKLRTGGYTQADTVTYAITTVKVWRWGYRVIIVLTGHVAVWVLLIFVYPRSSMVQAICFWNPWGRRFIGLGYVGFALTWVPFLRRTLLAPFKPSLLADAKLDSFDPAMYFPDSRVKLHGDNTQGPNSQQPITKAIAELKGQIILVGSSGLGKTMFLKDLIRRSRRVVVYLPAEKCAHARGVMGAIQAKLHGPAQDSGFLRKLIYSGAVDICIDGLNEVTADTRAKITQFMESYFKGNILLATQPLEWRPPATARTYVLQPLDRPQTEAFLLTRRGELVLEEDENAPDTPDAPDIPVTSPAYEQACREYLQGALDESQPKEVLVAVRGVLSNPMDLTVVAQMISQGKQPDLFGLEQQQYEVMADDYQRVHLGQPFPLAEFSQHAYEMRRTEQKEIGDERFGKELECMYRYRMVLFRQDGDGQTGFKKQWYFRHDKIMEYFIVQVFLGAGNDLPKMHFGEPEFRGVYFLLAMLLPIEEAEILREQLIDYAADTSDHTVSDRFIQMLRSRRAVQRVSSLV